MLLAAVENARAARTEAGRDHINAQVRTSEGALQTDCFEERKESCLHNLERRKWWGYEL